MTQRKAGYRTTEFAAPSIRSRGGFLMQLRFPSNRQALVAAVASATLFVALVILWLAVSTRTAVLNRQLDENDRRLEQISYETNLLWKQIGDATASQEMDRRMRDAGYRVPDRLEYLVSTTALSKTETITAAVSATKTLAGGSR